MLRRISGIFLGALLTGAGACAAPSEPPPLTSLPAPSADDALDQKAPPPLNPFPPPAPAVVDPRSGAWEQHRGFPAAEPCPESAEAPAIGAGRKRGVLERLYRVFHPYCPGCR